jgi:hypothetical protein
VVVLIAAVRREEFRVAAACPPKVGAGPVVAMAAAAPGVAAAPASGHLVKAAAGSGVVAEALLMALPGSVVAAPRVPGEQADSMAADAAGAAAPDVPVSAVVAGAPAAQAIGVGRAAPAVAAGPHGAVQVAAARYGAPGLAVAPDVAVVQVADLAASAVVPAVAVLVVDHDAAVASYPYLYPARSGPLLAQQRKPYRVARREPIRAQGRRRLFPPRSALWS